MKTRANSLLRFLDRYVGIPLLFCCAYFRKKRPLPKTIRTIALLKTACIGDTVLFSALIADLRRAYPAARILFFVGESNGAAAQMIPRVEIIPIPIARPWEAIRIVRRTPVDLWIDGDPWPRISSLLSLFARASHTIGFQTPRQGRHFGYDSIVPHTTEVHELDNYRKLLAPLGIKGEAPPTLAVAGTFKKEKRFCFHLHSAGRQGALKKWPDSHWRELIEHVTSWGYEVVLTGGNGERAYLDTFCLNKNVVNAAGISLWETAQILRSSLAVVSIDTGMMHLAAALGSSVIALHGPTDPKRWGAVGERVIAIRSPFPYTPCMQYGFDSTCKTCRCMGAIDVERVEKILKDIHENSDFSGGERDPLVALIAQ